MKMIINGKEMEMKKVGFVSNVKPGEECFSGAMEFDVWMAEDGTKFVEYDFLDSLWGRYDYNINGIIWENEDEFNRIDFIVRLTQINAFDAMYDNWCLTNNWLKGDNQAAVFVCGDDLFDEDWKEWIEQ